MAECLDGGGGGAGPIALIEAVELAKALLGVVFVLANGVLHGGLGGF